MKRITRIALLVLALMLVLPSAARAAEADKPLVVASLTQMSGNFTTNMWGNNTADVDMRLLLHGYPTVYEGLDQQYAFNEVALTSLTTQEDADRGKTFRFTVRPGLSYNDGSPITAKDYVFSLLLTASPFIGQIGGSPTPLSYIKGMDEYYQQPTKAFSGVRLLGEMEFSLSITPESFPHANELVYADILPYPYRVIAPGTDIVDDGEGAYISGPWSAELLATTMLDPVSGYLSHPMVTSGPYSLVSFDQDTGRAELALNPLFKGDPFGQRPTIRRLVYEPIANKDILSKLQSGEVDLINKASAREVTDAAQNNPQLASIGYDREGLAYLLVATERSVMSTVGVRQAVAYSMDVDALINDFLGDKGFRVYGFYGMSTVRAREYAQPINRIPTYQFDAAAAIKAVEADGYTLDETGEPFDGQAGGIRYRRDDAGQLIPLSITLGITPDNLAADMVARQLEQNLPRIGAQFNLNIMSMPALLAQYYRQAARSSDLYFIGSNFMKDFTGNPAGYSAESFDQGNNPAAIVDKELSELTVRLRETRTNRNAYLLAWQAYQTRMARVLPIIPLYTSVYTDIYSQASGLTGYDPQSHWSWGEAILYAQR
ncbi:MAG: hypothetical protein GX653_03395 [Clostridiales bacterium]|nr:hypothetical protein [Clostridiales bacterium]